MQVNKTSGVHAYGSLSLEMIAMMHNELARQNRITEVETCLSGY